MRIIVKVKLKAAREGVTETAPGTYEVSVNEPPEKGKANRAVVRLLAEHLGVPVSRISIIAGHASRSKIVEAR